MAWSGRLTSSSAVGSSTTFTPNTSDEGLYTVANFIAPRKGVYQFVLKGSGGTNGATNTDSSGAGGTSVSGGKGGSTTGYLLLEKDQEIFVGAGGTCSAAFVSKASGSNLRAIGSSNIYFVAGAGGAAGKSQKTNYANYAWAGGNGGGSSGAAGANSSPDWTNKDGGGGGTQTAAGAPVDYGDKGASGAYGIGGASIYSQPEYQNVRAWSGRGGDGWYGGASGQAMTSHNSSTGYGEARAWGGGGGSGYVKTATLTVMSKTYTSSTSQGSGASAGSNGSVVITYYARAELPVIFNGTQLERLIFNGTEIESLIFDGTKLFIESIKRRWNEWSTSMRTACRSRVPI